MIVGGDQTLFDKQFPNGDLEDFEIPGTFAILDRRMRVVVIAKLAVVRHGETQAGSSQCS